MNNIELSMTLNSLSNHIFADIKFIGWKFHKKTCNVAIADSRDNIYYS